MDVYVELVILDNAAITYLIARLTYRVCAIKRSRLRIFAACVAGTVFALFYPLIKTAWIGWALRGISYSSLCAILFAGKRKFVLPSLAFLLITFCFGGAIFAIGFAITGDANSALNMRFSEIPIFAIVAGAVIPYSMIKRALATVKRKREIARFTYDFSFRVFGEEVTFRGFVDTGNAMKHNGVPIALISVKSLVKKLSAAGTIKLAEKKSFETKHIKTATGDGKITLLPTDNFILYTGNDEHILYDVAVGTSARDIGESGEYDALLPAEILEAIERSEGVVDETEKIA